MGRLLLQPRAAKVCGDRCARCLERDMRSVRLGPTKSDFHLRRAGAGADRLYIYRPFAPRDQANQIDAFIAKGGLPIVFYRPGWTAGRALDIGS